VFVSNSEFCEQFAAALLFVHQWLIWRSLGLKSRLAGTVTQLAYKVEMDLSHRWGPLGKCRKNRWRHLHRKFFDIRRYQCNAL